jgi:hypothetical protein
MVVGYVAAVKGGRHMLLRHLKTKDVNMMQLIIHTVTLRSDATYPEYPVSLFLHILTHDDVSLWYG